MARAADAVFSPASMRAMLDGQKAQIDALDQRSLRAVLPALIDARDELRRDLSAWLGSHPDGEERFTAQQMRQALAALDGSLERVAELRGDMAEALKENASAAGRLSAIHLNQQVTRFGAAFGDGGPADIQTAALLARGENLLFKHYESSARRYAGQVGDDIRHQLAVGVAKGETFSQLKERLVRLGGPGPRTGNAAEDISQGLFRRSRYQAERLVRTEMINAYNVQHQEGIALLNEVRDDPEDVYTQRWDASLDKRACPICRDLNEKEARLGELFPGGYKHPPAHPCCRCVVVAWHARWGDFSRKTGGGGTAPPAPAPAPRAAPAAPASRLRPQTPQDAAGNLVSMLTGPTSRPAPTTPRPAGADRAAARAAAAAQAALVAKERAAALRVELADAKREAASRLKAALAKYAQRG